MNTIKKIIVKVADLAKKAVLVGAIVGGISLMANATETTAGPTIEKAQLETVHINLDKVVAAIAKADPDWVKGLPVVKTTEGIKNIELAQDEVVYFQYDGSGSLIAMTDLQVAARTLPPLSNPDGCNDLGGSPCSAAFEPSDVIEYDPTNNPGLYLPINPSAYQEHYVRSTP